MPLGLGLGEPDRDEEADRGGRDLVREGVCVSEEVSEGYKEGGGVREGDADSVSEGVRV